MRLRLAVVVFCLLTVLASHVGQGSGASAGSNAGRQADLAGIEKLHQRDIAATLSRDPVALTDLWTKVLSYVPETKYGTASSVHNSARAT
jgi:hypothetical protein